MPTRFHTLASLAAAASLWGAVAHAETIKKQGKTASGQTCTIMVEKHADGSMTALSASGGASSSSSTSSTGSLSGSTSAGGNSVQIQAGNGSVSSSTSMGGGGSASTSVMTVDGCTITTSSP
jgi:hypothetical protein